MKEKTSNSEILKTLGKNIKQIRLLKGLTQENLANDLDKSVNFISLLENGATGISIQSLVDICKVLECDVNSLFVNIIPAIDNNLPFESEIKYFEGKDKEIVDNLIRYIIDSKG